MFGCNEIVSAWMHATTSAQYNDCKLKDAHAPKQWPRVCLCFRFADQQIDINMLSRAFERILHAYRTRFLDSAWHGMQINSEMSKMCTIEHTNVHVLHMAFGKLEKVRAEIECILVIYAARAQHARDRQHGRKG